jgi:hypothetical protein
MSQSNYEQKKPSSSGLLMKVPRLKSSENILVVLYGCKIRSVLSLYEIRTYILCV